MRQNKILIFFILLILSICACISSNSVPNKPFGGNYPDTYNLIKKNNPLLAIELAKLPEIQDGISKTEEVVFDRIMDLYMIDKKAFDEAFIRMYNTGMPDVRKYCTPLQALFWLIQDGKMDLTGGLIKDYSLKSLLDAAWNDLFSWTKTEKWNEFQTVADRLNSPELLDYYERKVIRYKYLSGYGEDQEEVYRVFRNKYGHCAQITAFTVYILERNGYAAQRKIVDHPALRSPRGNDHRVSLFIVKGKKYIMDNGRRTPYGIIRLEDYDPMIHPYLHNYYEVWNEMAEN